MPRRLRLCPPAIPQHIIQRGNNRQICFASDEDCAAYANWLHQAAVKYAVKIHAWVFMTNHVHLLVTPEDETGVSLMMQSLGRQYVRYFNTTYRRSGTLWEGRFKSCLIQTTEYLLHCYRYIELNPVRASMVEHPADYIWSSYRSNAMGIESAMRTPHEEYWRLGKDKEERLRNYQALFATHIEPNILKAIRESLNTGLVLGNDRFKDELATTLAMKVRLAQTGRKPRRPLAEMLL